MNEHIEPSARQPTVTSSSYYPCAACISALILITDDKKFLFLKQLIGRAG
jgi:hypothetical protein